MHMFNSPPRSHRQSRRPARAVRPLLVAGLLFAGALPVVSTSATAAGIVDAFGGIGIGNLRFAFSDPAAVLSWRADWYGEVGAYAHGADAGEQTGYWYVIGNDDSTATAAEVAGARSQSDYRVSDGAGVATSPDAVLSAGARTGILLGDTSRQADGYAYAIWNNYFSISSTSPVGATVSTTISLDYTGTVEASTSGRASFEVLLDALLAVYDIDDATLALSEPALGADAWTEGYAGRAGGASDTSSGTLTMTVALPYNDIHWLYAGAQSAAYGVPAAGTLPLLIAGLGLMMRFRRRRR